MRKQAPVHFLCKPIQAYKAMYVIATTTTTVTSEKQQYNTSLQLLVLLSLPFLSHPLAHTRLCWSVCMFQGRDLVSLYLPFSVQVQ